MEQTLRLNELTIAMKRFSTLVLIAASAVLAGCAASNSTNATGNDAAGGTSGSGVEIKGEAMYRERIALPADSKLIVQLLDVSRMDAPAVVLAEKVSQGAKSPTPFKFSVSRDSFVAGHTYAVGARVMLADKLLFINTQAYRVDLNSAEPMTIVLEKVGR